MLDSYLGDELLIETNHGVLRHLENCPACRSELAVRRELLAQMRAAVKNSAEAQINPVFAGRLQNDLRQTALRPGVWGKLKSGVFVNLPIFAAAMACLLIGVFFGAIWLRRVPASKNTVAQENQTGNLAETALKIESSVGQFIQIAWQEITHAAIGDHENCALHYRLKEDPITLTEAAKKYGRFNKDLDKTVIALLRDVSAKKVTGESVGKIEFYDAHSCVYNGRRFTHIELRRGKTTISVLVTDADSFAENDAATFNQTAENFQVSGFRTARHAIFVVSDLSEPENSAIAETLAPAVRRHIEQAEA